jgi:hypothetical protein
MDSQPWLALANRMFARPSSNSISTRCCHAFEAGAQGGVMIQEIWMAMTCLSMSQLKELDVACS